MRAGEKKLRIPYDVCRRPDTKARYKLSKITQIGGWNFVEQKQSNWEVHHPISTATFRTAESHVSAVFSSFKSWQCRAKWLINRPLFPMNSSRWPTLLKSRTSSTRSLYSHRDSTAIIWTPFHSPSPTPRKKKRKRKKGEKPNALHRQDLRVLI